MRLTLRTLLAWLDDTLPPAEVREIGKQVSESPFAQELVERIHRVCRQRRLTVPSRNGPEGTDPNVVAGYVDNDLDPEQVTEYEKKCLTSDVNLAEAACVHQILSLLGQKVHVPPEAKARMALLVKGRESIPAAKPDGIQARPREPVTKPIQPWVAPEPPSRPWLERFGPALACLALIGILSWSAYQSLSPTTPEIIALAPPQPAAPAPGEGEPAAGPAPPIVDRRAAPGETGAAPDEAADAAHPEADTVKNASPTDTAGRGDEEKPSIRAVPDGAVGVADRVGGVLLRFNADSREWERIGDGAPIAAGDQLICLAPFRSRIVIGSAVIRLIGETQLRVLPFGAHETPAFELVFGRAVIESSIGPGPIRVELSGRRLVLGKQDDQITNVGLEHAARWNYGEPVTRPAPLMVHVPDGELTLSLDQNERNVKGPGAMMADPGGKMTNVEEKAVPEWVTATEPSEKEQKLGEMFAALFSRDGHVLADIVSATESESPVAKKYAVHAIKALGDLTFLIPILTRPKDPSARQSAAAALREFLAQGPDAAKKLSEPLAEEFGEMPGATIEKLLQGYSPEEAENKETIEELIDHLSPREPSLTVRELALENLRVLTGKDAMGYDPENPDDKSIAAWKSALNQGELKPAARRKSNG